MPLITESNFSPPFWLFNNHLETIFPALLRSVVIDAQPDCIDIQTPDGDYFNLLYYNKNASKTMIVSHGLEGNNKRPYISGMVRIFYENDWNVIAWNYRGCNGKTNKSIKSYHSGFTEDLVEVVQFALSKKIEKICLIGFSLGGNLTLKYLGDPALCHEKVRAAVAISAPVDLHKSCEKISKKSNIIYARRFLRTLKNKVRQKARLFPEINTKKLSKIHDLMSFDNHYTAPIHGFKDAMDYYRSCSSLAVLKDNIDYQCIE